MRSLDQVDAAGQDRWALSRFAIPSRLVPLRLRHVFALYLQYGDEHHASGMAVLRRQVARLFPGSRASFLVIDNALDADTPPPVDGDETRLPGDNINREFSGWDRGLQWLRSSRRVSPNDIVVLANDTFYRSFGQPRLGDKVDHGVAGGRGPPAFVGRRVAFSCKATLYSSCNARRMEDTADHLVRNVLAAVAVRHWVPSMPSECASSRPAAPNSPPTCAIASPGPFSSRAASALRALAAMDSVSSASTVGSGVASMKIW